jgi:hypothetical protein
VLEGVDLVNGTPILDVKPYIPTWDDPARLEAPLTLTPPLTLPDRPCPILEADFEAHERVVTLPEWAETPAIYEHGLQIRFTLRASDQLQALFGAPRGGEVLFQDAAAFTVVLGQLLAAEPRSKYRRDRCSDRPAPPHPHSRSH